MKSKPKKEDKGDDIISTLLCSLDDDINMDMMLGWVLQKPGLRIHLDSRPDKVDV